MNVLVVDDERDVELLFRQRFRREIREGKIQLLFAFSGEEALSILESSESETVLVLSDINMPGMSGLDLLTRIKQINASLPVFMVTAYANDFQARAVELGADDFLTKPVDFEVLKKRILTDGDGASS